MSQLSALAHVDRPADLATLFEQDPGRAERYVVTAADLRVDYSKQLVDDAVHDLAG